MFTSSPRSDRTYVSCSTRTDSGLFAPEKAKGSLSPTQEDRECFYCHKRGHVVADCLALKQKQQLPSVPQEKDVRLIRTVPTLNTEQSEDINDKPDPCFKPFISKGFVLLTGNSKDHKVITLLRDLTEGFSLIMSSLVSQVQRQWSCRAQEMSLLQPNRIIKH